MEHEIQKNLIAKSVALNSKYVHNKEKKQKKKTTAINDAEMQQNINQIGIRHLKESKCSHGSHTAKWLKCCREKKRHQTNRRKLRHMENMWTHRFECACV